MIESKSQLSEDILNRIISFVERERGKYNFPLTRSTTLAHDLKMEGDDAYEFMEKFVTDFNIDHSEYRHDQYFSKEGFNLLAIIFSIFKKDTQDKKAITLGELEQAVKNGKLN